MEKYFRVSKHSVVGFYPKAQAKAHLRIGSQRKLPYTLGRVGHETGPHKDKTSGGSTKLKGELHMLCL